MKKILTIIGARPQFIKASVVSRAIQQTDGIEEIMLHTGQHFDANMSDVFFNQLGIPQPDIQLDIHGGSHGEMSGRMLAEIEQAIIAHQPDRVLVYGDTNSTLAGALAAAKLHCLWRMLKRACAVLICVCRKKLTVFLRIRSATCCFALPTPP